MYSYNMTSSSKVLMHYGIKGQKWGIRRYQNEDGSYTPAGRKRMQKQVDRIVAKQRSRGVRRSTAHTSNQWKVIDKSSKEYASDVTLANKWTKAFKAGKGSEEWKDWEDSSKKFWKKYEDQMVDAVIKDYNLKRINDEGREYIRKRLYE